ncbi:MAG TPA: GspH/FimT family pseudopilin [Luteibacter sp.]|jgi:type IV fimbrial biogenesis protein FimT|nr:GspH/FimT family pseudopilin [Luteibacter sp.]
MGKDMGLGRGSLNRRRLQDVKTRAAGAAAVPSPRFVAWQTAEYTMPKGRQKGVTWIEQSVAIVLLAILAAAAQPTFREAYQRHRLTTASDAITAMLAQTRGLALSSQAPAIACPTLAGQGCETIHWHRGWLIGSDRDRDGQPEAPLAALEAARARPLNIVTWRDGHPKAIFGPDGTAKGTNLTVLACIAGKPADARAIVVNIQGRILQRKGSKAEATYCAKADLQK